MTPTARTFVHVPFSPPLLLILAFQPILFHTIVTGGQYMLCPIEEFFRKSRAELFGCGVANDMSKVTHVLVCITLTSYFFTSSVCSGSCKNLFWCCFPSRRLPYTSICLSIFFSLRLIDVCIYPFVDFDILAPHDSI